MTQHGIFILFFEVRIVLAAEDFYCFALTKGLKEMGEKFEKIFRKNLKFPANFSWAETGNIYFYFCFGNKNKSSCSEARLPRLFYDLFRHIYMSLNSHMKTIENTNAYNLLLVRMTSNYQPVEIAKMSKNMKIMN